MKCFIFSSGKIESYTWLEEIDFSNTFIICADGGIRHTNLLGIDADVWMGDADSLEDCEIKAKKIIRFPAKKDNTDTDLAVMFALENGFTDISIIGALGGRIDHEFSHFCLLKKIVDNGAKGFLLDEKNVVTMENKSFEVVDIGKKYVSFFPFGGNIEKFSVKGLLYEADNILLDSGQVVASSNQFLKNKKAHVTFEEGCVLLIYSDD